ncbi:MAG: hypothetical protein ACREJ3_17250, partial [Polyangiaceae bacterium]
MSDEKKAKADPQPKSKADKGDKAAKGGKPGKKGRGGEGTSAREPAAVVSTSEVVSPRLLEKYKEHAVPALTKQFNYKN